MDLTCVSCVRLAGLKESMRQAELNNWSLDAGQMADLCSSINQFFTATGVIPPQTAAHPQPQVQHPTAAGAPQHGAMHPKAGQHSQHISAGQEGSGRPQTLSLLESEFLPAQVTGDVLPPVDWRVLQQD